MFSIIDTYNKLLVLNNESKEQVVFVKQEQSFYFLVNWTRRGYKDGWNKLILGLTDIPQEYITKIKLTTDHIAATGNVHSLSANDIYNLILEKEAFRQINPTNNVVTVNCNDGISIYTEASTYFTLNWTNVKNGMCGIHTIILSSGATISLGTAYDESSNLMTKKTYGTFSALAAGTYNIAWAALNLGVEKRIININIQKYA